MIADKDQKGAKQGSGKPVFTLNEQRWPFVLKGSDKSSYYIVRDDGVTFFQALPDTLGDQAASIAQAMNIAHAATLPPLPKLRIVNRKTSQFRASGRRDHGSDGFSGEAKVRQIFKAHS